MRNAYFCKFYTWELRLLGWYLGCFLLFVSDSWQKLDHYAPSSELSASFPSRTQARWQISLAEPKRADQFSYQNPSAQASFPSRTQAR